MKTTKLMMGAVAAVLLATGCGGGTSPEEACDQYQSSLKKMDTKLAACLDGFSFASMYDKTSCVADVKGCSDDDIDNALAQLDCGVNLMTCDAFATQEAADALQAKLDACEAKYPVSASCDGTTVDVGTNSTVRQALQQLRSRR